MQLQAHINTHIYVYVYEIFLFRLAFGAFNAATRVN